MSCFQVVWDEPDLLQNVKCVNPWLVELVSNMPTFNLSAYSPPRKKQRFLQDPYFQVINQLPMPSFSSNLLNYTNSLCTIQDSNSSGGIQGARHPQFGLSPSDFPFNKLPADMLLGGFSRLDHAAAQPIMPHCGTFKNNTTTKANVDISCLLTVGNPGQNFKESNETKAPHILLFGKLIHTEQKSSNTTSSASTNGNSVSEGNSHKTSNASDGVGSGLHQGSPIENNSDGGSPWYKDQHKSDLGTDNVNTLCIAL